MTTTMRIKPDPVADHVPETPAVERVHPPRWLISHLVNPIARRVLRHNRGQMSQYILLLGFKGRRSGRRYEVPVAYRRIDGRLAIFTNSGWRHNFVGEAEVKVTLQGVTHAGTATLASDPHEVALAYQRFIEESTESDISVTYQQLGIKVNVKRVPTLDELESMAKKSGLSIVWLDLVT